MSLFDTFRTAYAVRFFSVVVMLFYIAVVAPLWGGVLLWFLFVSRGDSVTALLALTVLLSVVAAGWFSRITAHYMAIDGQPFKLAVQSTFYPVAMKLSFLPIVGGYFERILRREKAEPIPTGRRMKTRPNKTPEPTTFAVTSRAIVRLTEMKHRSPNRDAARAAPAKVVAHL